MRLTIPSQRAKFIKRKVHADTDDPDQCVFHDQEELDRLITYCRDREEDTRFSPRDGMVHVAEVPVTVYEEMVRQGRDNPDGWREWLNDPDNAPFRTWKGRV